MRPRVNDGFLSYARREATDVAVCDAVYAGLRRMRRTWWQVQRLRLFRDSRSLTIGKPLWPEIENALEHSKYLILLASQKSASAPGVCREVDAWLARHDDRRRILIIQLDGELDWNEGGSRGSTALPKALLSAFETEPVVADFRPFATDDDLGRANRAFWEELARIGGPLYGVSQKQLLGDDDRAMRTTHRVMITMSLVILSLVFLGIRLSRRAPEATVQADGVTLLELSARQIPHDPRVALELARLGAEKTQGARANDALNAGLWAAGHIRSLDGHTGRVQSLAIEDTGTLMLTGSDNGTVRLFDFSTGSLQQRVLHPGTRVDWIRFAASGSAFLTRGSDQSVRLWETASGRCVRLLPHSLIPGTVTPFLEPGKELITFLYAPACFRSFDIVSGIEVPSPPRKPWHLPEFDRSDRYPELNGLRGSVRGPDGVHTVLLFRDKHARVVFTDVGEEAARLELGDDFATGARFSESGDHLVTVYGTDAAVIWSTDEWSVLHRVETPDQQIGHAFFSPDGRWFVTQPSLGYPGEANLPFLIHVWETSTGAKWLNLGAPQGTGPLEYAVFHPTQDVVVTPTRGGNILVWPLRPLELARSVSLPLEDWQVARYLNVRPKD